MSHHSKLRLTLAALALACSIGTAAAADFTFSGNIQNHNDVIRINFTLTQDATNVKVWTDSYQSGTNFDPITAVWRLPSGDKVGENDDNSSIGPGQTIFDSGLTFAFLPAGSYVFTIARYPNFASSNLSLPFAQAGETPRPVTGGTFWRVHLSGVDAANPVQTTTCASSGYTGTKLLWCQNICEKGYTGATLDMWIHRWTERYRDLPYCAREDGGTPM